MTRIRRAPLPAVLALAALAATCNNEPASPDSDPDRPPAAGAPVVRNGVEYRADLAVMESFPVQLAGRVTITNATGAAVQLTFPDGCVALLRAYRSDARVWDQSSGIACTMALVQVSLAPGESRTVQAPNVSAYEILGDELPDGDYEIRVYLRPDGGEVEISAGTTQLAIPRD
ncbi:MAG TPA: BsuPI-related putative proteinase inhibitor [Gemmatimonadota bacterium]|nr:BsuPI-related putative proteinase inhibitor [Gemmatimonadota bacterium]